MQHMITTTYAAPGLKSTTKIKYDSLCNIIILGAGCVVGCDGKDKERIINVP